MFRNHQYLLILILLFLVSCSTHSSNPVLPDTSLLPGEPPALTTAQQATSPDQTVPDNRYVWGLWEVYLDVASRNVEIVPLRTAAWTFNVTRLFDDPPSKIKIGFVGVNVPQGQGVINVDIDVGLVHPFQGLKNFTGFDLMLVLMGTGSSSIPGLPGITVPGQNDLRMLNADGYTRWFNASEFTGSNPLDMRIYQPGKLGTPGFTPTSELNPYKYYADQLGKYDSAFTYLVQNPDLCGAVNPGLGFPITNWRYLKLQFPVSQGIVFQYAVVAHWEPGLPPYDPVDFPPTAHIEEAPVARIIDHSTVYYVSPTDKGGKINLDITPWDWTASLSGGVFDEYVIKCYSEAWGGEYIVPNTPTGVNVNRYTFNADITPTYLPNAAPIKAWIAVTYPEKTWSLGIPNGASGDLASFFYYEIPVSTSNTQNIHVTSPNGGEEWIAGSTHAITWTTKIGGTVRIEYSKDDFATNINLIAAGEANDGTYSWLVPNDPSSTLKVRVISEVTPSDKDKSDGNFSIFGPFITVTSPNGGEEWGIGTTNSVTWNTNVLGGTVTIEYSKDGFGADINTIALNALNTGTYQWVGIPNDPTNSARVRITHNTLPAATDTSNGNFSIVGMIIQVTLPNGGETFYSGTSELIMWNTSFTVGTVTIAYSKDNFVADFHTIAANAPNTGSYMWNNIPNDPSTTVRVRVTYNPYPVLSDTSDGNFTILNPYITVFSPNGGEVWMNTNDYPIVWNTNIPAGTVKIEYSNDNFVSDLHTLIAGAPNTGFYMWNNVMVLESTTYKVRITHNTYTNATDRSDNYFTILAKGFDITYPNGGEYLLSNSTEIVTWDSYGINDFDNVTLEWSTDGFVADINPIGTLNNVFHAINWLVPSIPDTSTVKVRIYLTTDPSVNDWSDANFSIVQFYLQVTSPAGGESLPAIITIPDFQIQWITGNIGPLEPIRLEYSTDNFVADINLIIDTDNSVQSYSWAPLPAVPGNYRIRATWLTDPTIFDVTDEFVIVAPTLQITSPNGGEQWQEGTNKAITWNTNIPGGDVMIEYSTDDFIADINPIVASTPNTGTYTWMNIPNLNSPNVRVRVTYNPDPSLWDVSNARFFIGPANITVIDPNMLDVWYAGWNEVINWTSLFVSGTVFIEYSHDDFVADIQPIAAGVANTGTYTWNTIPVNAAGFIKVRISSTANPSVYGISDQFQVRLPIIQVVSPNGGEDLIVTKSWTITWISANLIGNVKIEYSKDGFVADVHNIAANIPNSGSFLWSPIPDDQSSTVRIRISSVNLPALYDDSNANFNITVPLFEVTSPNGGEFWAVGSSHPVTWNFTDPTDFVSIYYSKDDFFMDNNLLAAGEVNDGYWLWSGIPNDPTFNAKVRVQSNTIPAAFDDSDNPFLICSPSPVGNVTNFSASDGNVALNQREVRLAWDLFPGCVEGYQIEKRVYNWGANWAPGSWAWQLVYTAQAYQNSWIDTDARHSGTQNPISYRIRAFSGANVSPAWTTDTGYPKLRNLQTVFWCVADDGTGGNPTSSWDKAMSDYDALNTFWNRYGFNYILQNPGGYYWIGNPAWRSLSGTEHDDMHNANGRILYPQYVNVYYTEVPVEGWSVLGVAYSYCPPTSNTTDRIHIVMTGFLGIPATRIRTMPHEFGHCVGRIDDLYPLDTNGDWIPDLPCDDPAWCSGWGWPMICDISGCYPQPPTAPTPPRDVYWINWGGDVLNYELYETQYVYTAEWFKNYGGNFPIP